MKKPVDICRFFLTGYEAHFQGSEAAYLLAEEKYITKAVGTRWMYRELLIKPLVGRIQVNFSANKQ